MRHSTPPVGEPFGKKRWPLGKRFKLFLLFGCLGVLIVPLFLSWISIRLLQPSPPTLSGGLLSWERDLGNHDPGPGPPTSSPVSPAQGSFTLPGVLSVEDAVEWENGWVLLDRRLGKVHFLDVSSGSTRSTGGKGPGPGELEEPVALAIEDTLLWVLNQRGMVLDRFSVDSGFQARRRVLGGGCLVGLAKRLLVLPEEGLFLLRVCPATLPLGQPGSRKLHFLRQPALAAGSDHLFLGTWDTPCIAEIDRRGEVVGDRCLPDYLRPGTPAKERSDLERRFRRITQLGLLPMDVPTHLPWYDRIFVTSRGLVVRRLRGMEDRDLVLLPVEGGSSVTDYLFPENTFVGNRSILTVEDLLQGTRVRIFRNPWQWGQ
ncbi:MAG: hypothetical protein ABIF09_15970 [Gemmatimonadota bacterium]